MSGLLLFYQVRPGARLRRGEKRWRYFRLLRHTDRARLNVRQIGKAMGQLSRRRLLELGGLSALSVLAGNAARCPAAATAVPALKFAAYADVMLFDGPLLDQFRAQHATLLAMDEDALLKPYRTAAGLAAPGEDLGGWYNASLAFDPPRDMHGFIPGHSLGQYISSLARAYAVTGDEATRQKVQRLVAGYAATITPRLYDGYPLPAYLFDKINIGL